MKIEINHIEVKDSIGFESVHSLERGWRDFAACCSSHSA